MALCEFSPIIKYSNTGGGGSLEEVNTFADLLTSGATQGDYYRVKESTGFFWNKRRGTYRLIGADPSVAGNWERQSRTVLAVQTDEFTIRDATDTSKVVDWDTSAVSGSTTRTITMPDADVDLSGVSDTKAAIDSGATSQYVGAASSDGFLRTDSTFDYADGGNYITIGLDATLKSNYDAANAHISADGSSHTFIDQNVVSGSSPTFDGANITGVDASNVDITEIGTATYDDVQDFIKVQGSAGYISGGTITDAGSQQWSLAAGTGWIRSTDSSVGVLSSFDWSADNSNAIADDTIAYIFMDYNAGSPQVNVKSTFTNNSNDEFFIGSVVREGTTLHIYNNPDKIVNSIAILNEKLRHDGFDRVEGLILGETGTRNVTVTAGEYYFKLNEVAIAAIDTSGADDFDSYLSNVSSSTANSQWDNDNYDNAGSLTALSSNRYGVLWFYMESDGMLVCLYGTSNAVSEAGAEAEAVPTTLPKRIEAHGFLIGRIIFQKGAGTASAIETVFGTTFSSNVATDHGNLAGLADDDHTQYLLADGTRALAGAWSMGSQATTNVNIDTGSIAHEAGGLEADVSGYAGLVHITGGTTSAKTIGIADDNIVEIDDADAADNDYAKLTANGIEGRSYAEVLTDLSGQAGAAFAWNAQNQTGLAGLRLNKALASDGTYSGLTRAGTLGATIAFGDLCYLAVNSTAERWELADADAVATSGDVDLALCLVAGNDGDPSVMLMYGFIREDDWNFTSGGDALYVSTTTGDMAATAPSASGDVVRVVGYATESADIVKFDPGKSWVEIA